VRNRTGVPVVTVPIHNWLDFVLIRGAPDIARHQIPIRKLSQMRKLNKHIMNGWYLRCWSWGYRSI